jgi:hypothetical protein
MNNNNNNNRKNDGRRPPRPQDQRPVDLWRPVRQLSEPQPVVPVNDPTMLVRSLGDPPLPGKAVIAGHYVAAVVERAAGLATALAASVDLLASADEA